MQMADVAATPLRVTEIFYSLQGEARTVGCPTVFVRLTGCPLRCHYCDTEYAFSGGEQRSIAEILSKVAEFSPQYVTVTGGEPLAQPACQTLLVALCDAGYEVSLETSGAFPLKDVDARVSRVMDLKTPASGEMTRNLYQNIEVLTRNDQVKFVICDRRDYEWARSRVQEYALSGKVGEVLFSPSFEQLRARDLAEWVIEDRLPVRMQVQLHKFLWGEEQGR